MSLHAPILFPGDTPDGFEAWLRRVAMPCGTVETADGRVLEIHETKARIGDIPPGSQLSRRTLKCVFGGEGYGLAIPAPSRPQSDAAPVKSAGRAAEGAETKQTAIP